MSKIGNLPISIPSGVTVTQTGSEVMVKGPKGELKMEMAPTVVINQEGDVVTVTRSDNEKQTKSLHGLYRSLLHNMVVGVTAGFTKTLEIIGVGLRAEMQGANMVLHLGFSHPVPVKIPEGLQVTLEKNTVVISGIDKQLVGQFAAEIRSLKKPEPYKGKGIKYIDEVIRRKAGKTAKTGA